LFFVQIDQVEPGPAAASDDHRCGLATTITTSIAAPPPTRIADSDNRASPPPRKGRSAAG